MNIQEVANSYAEGKANEAITKAIAQAYIDGFNDGYKSGKENAQVECNDTEFVDLGLPSGTLWSSDFLRNDDEDISYFTYSDIERCSLPTIKQWNELISMCKWTCRNSIDEIFPIQCVGPNGNVLSFSRTGFIKSTYCIEELLVLFWLLDNKDFNVDKKIAMVSYSVSRNPDVKVNTITSFCGFKFPVRLVR